MPLAFESESHGTIAFGFFNIESDLLLLDRYFFFANDFCDCVCNMAKEQTKTINEFLLHAYVIKDPAAIGDLHGGIAGTHYSGFIGETYKKYPFPRDETKFKQQTDGFRTRDEFDKMILDFGSHIDLDLIRDNETEQVSIGGYVFTRQNFRRLIHYVIRGGFPRWLDDTAPDYVIKMQEAVTLD
jgi:hypothetical protein